STGAPERRLTDAPAGFSQREVDGETWRVFTVEDADKGVRVIVGDRLGLRERLVTDLIMGLVTPAILMVPLLGMLIWASLGRGLRPLRLMARDLAGRGADEMSAIDTNLAPAEVRPLADALNGLFLKVESARRHEREVTAFAAHELRTPLAGLKVQAQVAMAATDPDVAKAALRQILAAVDRTTRLVRQLLDAA
ncbi:histidine kinase dimerization/phospho-acceptor domain-containing protein, partial [Methylobacterium hispanicum]